MTWWSGCQVVRGHAAAPSPPPATAAFTPRLGFQPELAPPLLVQQQQRQQQPQQHEHEYIALAGVCACACAHVHVYMCACVHMHVHMRVCAFV